MTILEDSTLFRKNVWEVIFQNVTSPKAPSPEAPSFRGDPRSNLEVFCHKATFQECQQSQTNENLQFNATRSGGTGSHKIAGDVSGHFCLVKNPQVPYGAKYAFGVGGESPLGPSLVL